MDGSLTGRKVVLLESRRGDDLANLILRRGGRVRRVPAVHEAPIPGSDIVSVLMAGLEAGRIKVVIALTGVAVTRMLEATEEPARLLAALARATLVCRGPKPAAVLKRLGLPYLSAEEPHTTAEVERVLDGLDVRGVGVAILHYGELDEPLRTAVRERGGETLDVCLYVWELPPDLGPLRQLVADIVAGRVEAIAFTSQIQARHLWSVAAELGHVDDVVAALNGNVVVAAIGPTCTAALAALGVKVDVQPEHGKMGQLVAALAEHWMCSPSTARAAAD
jgi:uroporphyrinogen-III synthase